VFSFRFITHAASITATTWANLAADAAVTLPSQQLNCRSTGEAANSTGVVCSAAHRRGIHRAATVAMSLVEIGSMHIRTAIETWISQFDVTGRMRRHVIDR
jgi:hypothetical protein